MSCSLEHVNFPLLIDEDAQESVVLDVVRDTPRVDAD